MLQMVKLCDKPYRVSLFNDEDRLEKLIQFDKHFNDAD